MSFAEALQTIQAHAKPAATELEELYRAELAAAEGLDNFRAKAAIANNALTPMEKSAKTYGDALAEIALKSELMGDGFDATSARIQAMQARLNDLTRQARETGSGVTDEMRSMQAAIDQAVSDQKFTKSMENVFLSVTDTFTKMAEGLIQGTLDIGDAFSKLGQS